MEGIKEATKQRILTELLRGIKCSADEWRILIVDEVTMNVVSSACKLSDVTEENVSLIEDLFKRREPMPQMSAIYFVTPTAKSVQRIVEDFEGEKLMYRKAHVFFSNHVSKSVLNIIKKSEALTARLATLKEFNMEYTPIESRAFLAAAPDDLNRFYSERCHEKEKYEVALNSVTNQLATLFASLQEVPSIRFRAPAPGQPTDSAAFREQLCTKVAMQLGDHIEALQQRLPDFPHTETCDMLIVDRTVDPVAPVVHDWSYEALCHDLLPLKPGGLYSYRYENNSGKMEQKEVALEEGDKVFRELKGMHFADACTRLAEWRDDFLEKNKVAKSKVDKAQKGGGGGGPSMVDMKAMLVQMDSYRKRLAVLSLHKAVADDLTRAISSRGLNKLGELEQDLIFGDANSKDIKRALEAGGGGGKQSRGAALAGHAERSDRLRMLLCYFGTHEQKLDGPAGLADWLQRAGLHEEDGAAVLNLQQLGCVVLKQKVKSKPRNPPRKKPEADDGYDLQKFVPRIQELALEMARGDLSTELFPYVSPPKESVAQQRAAAKAAKAGGGAVSARTARHGKRRDDGTASAGDVQLQVRGRRLIIFIIGPMGHTEVRAAHELSAALGRDVIIGATSLQTPEEFLTSLKGITGPSL